MAQSPDNLALTQELVRMLDRCAEVCKKLSDQQDATSQVLKTMADILTDQHRQLRSLRGRVEAIEAVLAGRGLSPLENTPPDESAS